MGDTKSSDQQTPSGKAPMKYPVNRVMGAVDQQVLGPLVQDLIAAGFAPVGILAGEAGLRRLSETSEGSGLGGALRKFSLSTGGDLDHIRQAEEELRNGHAMVDVEVAGDEEKTRARDVFLNHGGHFISHMSSWAIEPLG